MTLPPPDDARHFREACRVARMYAFDWDLTSDRITRDGDVEAILSLSREEIGECGSSFLRLVHPHDRDLVRDAIAGLEQGSPKLAVEYRVTLPNGAVLWLQDTAEAEFTDGRATRLRGFTIDITQRREAELRLTLLAAISELIGTFDDPADLLYAVSCAVGEHLHVRRCLFSEIDVANDRGLVRRDYCRDVPSVAGVYRVSDYSQLTLLDMSAGRTVINVDAKSDPRTAASYAHTYEPNGERAYISVPLLRDGRWVAVLWISDDVPRHWSEQDIALLQSVAERVWTAVEKLRVHAALTESEARVQFVGERADVGYWYWDLPSNSLDWSPVCRRLFGLSPEDPVTYARFLELIHPDDRLAVEAGVRSSIERNVEYDAEFRIRRPDGSERWIRSKGSATFEDGVAVRMAGIALDITQRRLLDQQREELLALERRLRKEADEASLAKDHFLALLSHELRTPMTTILGWASFLGSGMAESESVKSGIESIEQASRAQARLIDDLLDVSRIITGKMSLEQKLFDVTDTVRRAIEVVQPSALARDIHITSSLGATPLFVSGDAARIQQVIWNLLSNSVKFTPIGGHIDVSVHHDAGQVAIHVRDDGEGVDPEFLPHMFERFRQAEDGPSRSFGGLGLGLSIARHLTEMHGGTIRARSEGPGRGSEFVVTLPRLTARAPIVATPGEKPPVDRQALRGVSILLVDDDASARRVIGAMLSGFGANVSHAGSTSEALLCLSQEHADLLVSDIGMPVQDGYELIRLVRSGDTRYARVPAIAVTAYADPRDRERALSSGFQAHVTKPVEPRTLASAVIGVLRDPASS